MGIVYYLGISWWCSDALLKKNMVGFVWIKIHLRPRKNRNQAVYVDLIHLIQ